MGRLTRIVRLLCAVAGTAGMALAAWAFVDPSAFPAMALGGSMADPPSPRWRAAFAFVFSLAVAGYGFGILRHRELP